MSVLVCRKIQDSRLILCFFGRVFSKHTLHAQRLISRGGRIRTPRTDGCHIRVGIGYSSWYCADAAARATKIITAACTQHPASHAFTWERERCPQATNPEQAQVASECPALTFLWSLLVLHFHWTARLTGVQQCLQPAASSTRCTLRREIYRFARNSENWSSNRKKADLDRGQKRVSGRSVCHRNATNSQRQTARQALLQKIST